MISSAASSCVDHPLDEDEDYDFDLPLCGPASSQDQDLLHHVQFHISGDGLLGEVFSRQPLSARFSELEDSCDEKSCLSESAFQQECKIPKLSLPFGESLGAESMKMKAEGDDGAHGTPASAFMLGPSLRTSPVVVKEEQEVSGGTGKPHRSSSPPKIIGVPRKTAQRGGQMTV